MFEKYNNYVSTIKEGIDLQSMEFTGLKSFVGQSVLVDGFFFTDGKYGKQVVVVGNGYKINIPPREVSKFEDIARNEDDLKAVLDGKLALTDIREKKTTNGTTVVFKYSEVK